MIATEHQAPHHPRKEWIKEYKGKFDQGWDKVRQETFGRQEQLSIIPANTQLTPRHKEIPAWDSLRPPRLPGLGITHFNHESTVEKEA